MRTVSHDGPPRDPVHPFSDPPTTPNRLCGEISEFVDACFAPGEVKPRRGQRVAAG